MSAYKDIAGQRFGRLVAIKHVKDSPEHKGGGWICKCDCGNTCFSRTSNLTHGNMISCGCYNKEKSKENKRARKHGMSKTRIYITWRNMRVRCSNPNDREYKNYGGRGITVCPEWRDSFEVFRDWAMQNGYRDDLTIDRIDVNKGYGPDNCRFITREKNNKTRREKERK